MTEYKSNAKINLMLKVVGVKGNLHLLEMIMVPISIYDIITIEKNDVFTIEGMDINLEDNIMYKMFCYLKQKYKFKDNVKIKINKYIPMQAGLGGGSSNAATVLKFVNEEMGLNLSEDEMVELSKEIGSDVSFFVKNVPAFVEGTGDVVREINNFVQMKGILIFDNDYSSTKEVYAKIDDYAFSSPGFKEGYSEIKFVNDLEKGVSEKMELKIETIKKELLKSGAYVALMSGSGGSVFGLYEDWGTLEKALESFKGKYKFVEKFVTL